MYEIYSWQYWLSSVIIVVLHYFFFLPLNLVGAFVVGKFKIGIGAYRVFQTPLSFLSIELVSLLHVKLFNSSISILVLALIVLMEFITDKDETLSESARMDSHSIKLGVILFIPFTMLHCPNWNWF